MAPPNYYAASTLNRAAERREDPAWLEDQRRDPASRYWPMRGNRHLLRGSDGRPLVLDGWFVRDLLPRIADPVFLGVAADGIAEFAVAVEGAVLEAISNLLEAQDDALGEADLRALGASLAPEQAGRLAYARAILSWHARNPFCPRCGNPTAAEAAGHRRRCTHAACAELHFPRVDPAVIMLVENGDHCLLGRQPHWLPGMHSVLAGFVEPGECLEEAVAREVWEETGVSVDRVSYQSSQPWPFPASMMLGFRAHALTGKLAVRDGELESVRWYRREELLDCPEDDSFRLPPRDSVAWRLLADWLAT